MAKRGRPVGVDSAQTRERIIDVAREEFARSGYAAAAMTKVASAADLAPSAIYHYFGGKAELYEAVFDATSSAIWGDLGERALGFDSLAGGIEALMSDSTRLAVRRPHYNSFLALVPTEARLHPEFAHLLDQRSKYQDSVFGALAEVGVATGELADFSVEEATELIRAVIMGSFFERHFRGGSAHNGQIDAIYKMFAALGRR